MPQRSRGGKFPNSELSRKYFDNCREADKQVGAIASCAGKFKFSSYDAAARSIRRVGRSAKQMGRLGPYHCPSCGGYHVGSRY